MSTVKKPYTPAVTPTLRRLLVVVFLFVALIGANSIYLLAVKVLESWTGLTYQNYFYQYMFLGHLLLGILLIVPFLWFALAHMRNTFRRKNRRAVWMGYGLFATSVVLLLSGLLLTRTGPFEVRAVGARTVFYWIHVIAPLAVIWFYCLHRLAGPPIKWRLGLSYLAVVGAAAVVLVGLHTADPRQWNQVGSPDGVQYFEPSLARTATGKFIPASVLDNDQYCQQCHADAHAAWAESAHRFSSFNNPAYLISVRETRDFSQTRDGDVKRSRWCAGCHDPVPFFSGRFDDAQFDDVGDPTAHAGITCTVCHAMTHVNSLRGNADYTIEEPLHYPFAASDHTALQWINRQLIKAKPSFHKKTFLKPFHKTAEFCSVCHKVHLPEALNDYKFLRGQNHYDPYLLSGVSGHGARSFYYPPVAEENCNGCHMPVVASDDFGARKFLPDGPVGIHDHLFLGANTAIGHWNDFPKAIRAHQEFLRGCARVDLFALRRGGQLDGDLLAPLRPVVPTVTPGDTYLLDVVIRTLTLGHLFTQGTVDSNEIWLDVVVKSGERVIGQSGQVDQHGQVDPWSHFVNVFMLDREGRRIDRRNAQDIFVALYNHQIPPGAGQTVHYQLRIPPDVTEPVTVEVKLQYRKFDQTYLAIVAAERRPGDPSIGQEDANGRYVNDLPITTIASDRLTFPAAGESVHVADDREIPQWQRWNDYGIGLLLKGKAELRQAAEAFQAVEELGRYDGPLNLARVYHSEGRLDEAVTAIHRAARCDAPPAPPWTVSWLSGLVNREQGNLREAEASFREVLTMSTDDMIARHFDFQYDYEVINLLGQTLFDRGRRRRGKQHEEERIALFRQAAEQFLKTLELDPENVTAHYNLQQVYAQLGETEQAERHRQLHLKYKPDDNARDRAVAAARQRYPAANHAAEAVVIYDLQRNEEDSID